MDAGYDGKIGFDEFVIYNNSKGILGVQKIKSLFKILDRNNNGFIDEFEFTLNFVDR